MSVDDEMPDPPLPLARVPEPDRSPQSGWSVECDWGMCNRPAVVWRYAGDSHEWLPVCEVHRHWTGV